MRKFLSTILLAALLFGSCNYMQQPIGDLILDNESDIKREDMDIFSENSIESQYNNYSAVGYMGQNTRVYDEEEQLYYSECSASFDLLSGSRILTGFQASEERERLIRIRTYISGTYEILLIDAEDNILKSYTFTDESEIRETIEVKEGEYIFVLTGDQLEGSLLIDIYE